ncbi:hypothetical protein [Eubacterium limosum]|uniref:hypothetical protein n=1 Tax=Eubacterium limosum TaxID=1736 RepID=UPI0010642C7A|nr:hypothetical protein [Eubacterium limosum]
MASSTINVIDKVVKQARGMYDGYMESHYVSVDVRIDGIKTKGQCKDNERTTNIKEEHTKMVTCMLDVPVHRGSLVEMQADDLDTEYTRKGIVISVPNKTPVDFYFYTLLFNTTAKRHRSQLTYNQDGDLVGNNPIVIDNIDCFVQRVGMRERQIDAGIDRNSVNQIITTNNWDIKKDDLLFIGSDRYKITDIEELDKEIFSAYMTYYRE